VLFFNTLVPLRYPLGKAIKSFHARSAFQDCEAIISRRLAVISSTQCISSSPREHYIPLCEQLNFQERKNEK
jgi:hypothetical protein